MAASRKTILWILGIVLFLTIGVKLFLIPSTYDDGGFFSNLITELIGAVVTFLVIDNILHYNEKKEKERLQAVAIRSLRAPLRRYLWAWIHASTDETTGRTELQTTTVPAYIISDTFIDRIINRSFNDPFTVTTMFGVDRPLKIKFPEMIEAFQKDIKDILDTYAYALDTDLIRRLQHFSDEAHLYNTIRFWKTVDIGQNVWFGKVDRENIRSHFIEFNILLATFNSNVSATEQWTNENLMNLNRVSGPVPNVKW